jgi:hypothetical protein
MDTAQTSYELLAHFDRPKLATAAELEWMAGVEPAAADEPPAALRTRGVRWVLQWAAAIGVLAFAASLLTEFAYLVAAEQSLNMAARAGATEATLPRATYQSITAAVERRLASYPQLNGQLQLRLLQNGTPVGQQFRVSDGDRVSIALSAPTSSVVPGWLRKLSPWHGDAPLNAHAEREVPGRKLRPAKS